MRRLLYVLLFLVALIVLDAIANDSRYTRPFVDMASRSAQRFTHAIGVIVDDILGRGA
jgi:hypothetical protein